MKIAIVGASKLNDNEDRDVRQFIALMLKSRMDQSLTGDITVISGGARGVDTCAEEVAIGLGIKTHIFKPEVEQWLGEGCLIGYKDRNIQIAKECDVIYCFPVLTKDTPCYHHCQDHQVSGGCWTLKKVEEMGKETHLIPPINR